jgi:urea transporter/murein DD-endopeptidase MepM/ murein hydrolase activator NlpD
VARLKLPPAARAGLELVLRPYGQIVFSRDLGSGVFILLAVASFPRLLVATLVAVAVSETLAWLFGLGTETIRDGWAGCIAVLTTLATAVFDPARASLTLVVLGAALSVLFLAAFQSIFNRLALPTHSLPFVAAAWTVNLAARSLPPAAHHLELLTPSMLVPARMLDLAWFDVPAAILFLHGAVAGVLVLLAILWYSRIAVLLAAVGVLAADIVRTALHPDLAWSLVDLTAAFNAVLLAIAVGGVWFVPHASSIVLSGVAAALGCAITYALAPAAGLLSLPLLSLPFVVTTQLVLAAARMRERDRWPSSAVPASRPEEALARHLMRVRRFGDSAWLPFRLPFRGTWTVTQGQDGAHTHQGPWRFAFDFEVRGSDGRTFDRDGRELRDYRCYGLPVLAAGTGTVDQVIDNVPDNPPGELNLRDNWGNAVVIAHGTGLYSVCAHLQPRTVRVRPGDFVAAGAEIGRCGNSGRSPVPHLHFQVQRGRQLGSATLAAEFGDVVTRVDASASRVALRAVPAEGDRVRPIVRDDLLAEALSFTPGSAWALAELNTGRQETARVEIDLIGNRLLRSDAGKVSFETYESGLVMVAAEHRADSLLRFVLLALARVPFDQESTLTWTDRVPRRLLLGRGPRLLLDLTSIIAPRLAEVDIEYSLRRAGEQVIVEGKAVGLTTRAAVSLEGASHRIDVTADGRTTSIVVAPMASRGFGHDERTTAARSSETTAGAMASPGSGGAGSVVQLS